MKDVKLNVSIKNYCYLFSLFLFVYNFNFIKEVYGITNTILATSVVLVSVFLVFNIVLRLIFWPKITKTISIILILLNTVASYFMTTYNVSIDYIMLLNLMHTDYNEARALFNVNMIYYIVFLIAIPIIIVCKTNIIYDAPKKNLINIAKHILTNFLLLAIILLPIIKKVDNFYREQKFLRYHLIPTNYIGATISLFKRVDFSHKEEVSIADDIKINKYWNNDKKNLVVFIIGESARAANFSLGGYIRPTNKELLDYQDDFV